MTTDASGAIRLHEFLDSASLAQALASAVAADLRTALAARGRAVLAVSGGNTPKAFMQALSRQPLDWAGVTVTLVDERWVPESSGRSNAALVRANLLQGPASAARFLPLFRDTAEPAAAVSDVARSLAETLPLDVAVLGMGEDGHTASFFPGGDHLRQALDPDGDAPLATMRAPGADEARITLTLPVLVSAARLYLHVEGQAKRKVLERAVSAPPDRWVLPIARVLRHAPAAVATYWSA
ncbi:MAG TPA: 6-phosphogluconolactonase [Pseudoxanthomonas sp.]|nr:6-phosphogluconolactonase [Pseudoxanthomonas sp.]